MSIQTKEQPAALAALSKAKGGRTSTIMIPQQASVVVETPKGNTEVPATPSQNPEAPATPAPKTNEPIDGRGDYKDAWTNLKAHSDKTIYELRQEKKQLEDELSKAKQAPAVKPPKTKEEIAAWKAANPDAFDMVASIALETVAATDADLKAKLEEVNRTAKQLKDGEAFKELLKVHPDAMEIRESSEFANWFNQQPEDIRNILATSSDIQAVSKQLTLYKLEVLGINPLEQKKAKVKENVDASMGVSINSRTEITPQKKMWTKTEIDAICADHRTYIKFAKEIDDARRENRVDMSK